jgi:hypothetical protein
MKTKIRVVFINRDSLNEVNLPITFQFKPSGYHDTECALLVPSKEKEASISEEEFDKVTESLRRNIRGTRNAERLQQAKAKLFKKVIA